MVSRIILLLFFFLASVPTAQGGDESPDKGTTGNTSINYLRKKIDALLSNPLFSSASIGIRIVSVQSSKSLYSLNQDKLFHPASNQKIIVTSAALHLLKQNFSFRTIFSTDGIIRNNILDGNLIIHGAGDPLVCTADFDTIASVLLRHGIRSIRGNIIGDISYFDSLYWGKGWMWDDEPYPESPFISPLSVNKNTITLLLQPGIHERDTVLWIQEPQTKFVSIINKGYTSSDTSLPRIKLTRPSGRNNFSIEGVMAPSDTGTHISASIRRPDEYFMWLLRERLESAGILCEGSTLIGDHSASAIFAVLEHPLDSVLHCMNKESDNLSAENLLKTIGAENVKKPGTADDGIESIRRHLYTYGIDTSAITLADGSGASWYNAVSPRMITEILLNECKNKETFKRLYESLSIAGSDGTLKNRMRKPHLRDRVHAKTGSLTGVNCISGYITMKNGTIAAFSIMINHFTCTNADVRQLEDDIIEAIALSPIK
jgi:D-alanyl-D-alanine carboxypeptidase/D-alanyl-D-alanine-endopeptidase (penicillin-binding protein 4)